MPLEIQTQMPIARNQGCQGKDYSLPLPTKPVSHWLGEGYGDELVEKNNTTSPFSILKNANV